MENLPSILTPDLGLLFWMLLAFLVVFVGLGFFAFPTIIATVTKRKLYIDESLSKANEASERLLHIKQEGEALLQEAREQQAKIMKEAAAACDAIVEQAQEKAHEESSRIISEAKKQIEMEKEGAIREIRSQVAELSVQVAEKILCEHLSNDKSQMDMINRLLDEVSQKEYKE